MALNIKLDITNCYPIEVVSEDFKLSKFICCIKNDQQETIGVHIADSPHPLLPNVYNLAFGPLDENNFIDDKARLSHLDHSRLFSTIVYAGMTFLNNNMPKYLGFDGYDNARAYLYYRCIQNNFDYLNESFNIYGVNYYARVLRKVNNHDEYHPLDIEDIVASPLEIKKEAIVKFDKLYNYFIFELKK